jgi:stage II sporulation protein M
MQLLTTQQKKEYDNFVFESVTSFKPQILFVVILFSAGIVIGITNIFKVNEFIDLVVGSLMNQFKGSRGFELFIKILLNNSKASALVIVSGFFFSIVPTLAALMNGMMIGFMFQNTQLVAGKSIFEMALLLIPHGIFEIPAMILALAIGVKLGDLPFKSRKIEFIKLNFKKIFYCYLKIIFPLLLIAAGIETIGVETFYYVFTNK